MPLLDIRNLTIEIETPQGMVKAVERMSLTLNEGEIRGLVGESGSGKSLVAKAIAGVTKTTGGSVPTAYALAILIFMHCLRANAASGGPRNCDDLSGTLFLP